jgi:hypothetical protein
VKTIEMEVAGLTDGTTVQDVITGIQVIVTGGKTTGVTEASIDEIVGQGQGPRGGGHDPGIGITGGGDVLKKESGMMATLTSVDGRITERCIRPTHSVFYNVRASSNSNLLLLLTRTHATDTNKYNPGECGPEVVKNQHRIRILSRAWDLSE